MVIDGLDRVNLRCYGSAKAVVSSSRQFGSDPRLRSSYRVAEGASDEENRAVRV